MHHEVGDNGEGADAHASEGGGSGDVPVQLLLQALHRVAVPLRPRPNMPSRVPDAPSKGAHVIAHMVLRVLGHCTVRPTVWCQRNRWSVRGKDHPLKVRD